ncbi:MAG: hypothetical protein WBF53_08675 [Litorimonas sp.]
MHIALPLILAGLAVAASHEVIAPPSHPAAVYAEQMTERLSAASSNVRVTYSFDEPSRTLRITGQLSQVIALRKIKLVADVLRSEFSASMGKAVDMEGLAHLGVGVVFDLIDRNRTPIEA